MRKIIIFSILLICFLSMISAQAQKTAFEPIDHTYIYDVNDDGSVRCIWSTTVLPTEPNILYMVSFRGGETRDYQAVDSLGNELDLDVNEESGQRAVSVLLSSHKVGQPYQFNLSFTWNGLLMRKESRHTLYTSVDLGEPQSAEIMVILPKDAKAGTSVVTRGNLTEPFSKQVISDRMALVWRTDNSGNETEIPFRANFNHYNFLLSVYDNSYRLLVGASIIIVAALLLGYRRRLPEIGSRIKGFLKDGMR